MRTKILALIALIVCVLFSFTIITSASAHHRPDHTKGKPSPTVTATPTPTPTTEPTVEPTPEPTVEPTVEPTPDPTPEPDGTKPGYHNTGYPTGTVLTPLGTSSQPLYITVDGTVIDSKEIYGDIKVQARNVTIKNSRLHCGNYIPSGNSGCIDANHANVYNLRIENNLIVPDVPSYFRDGVVGHEYTAVGNRLARTNDGFGVFNRASTSRLANVVLRGNFVHDTVYHVDDPAHSDGTHNDGVQVQGGENILIEGNFFDHTGFIAAGKTGDPTKPGAPEPHAHGCAVILQNNTNTPLKNVVVQDNWIDNGLASICVKPGEVTVQRNKFGTDQWCWNNSPTGQKYIIRIDSRSSTIVHGLNTNVWEDNGVALREGGSDRCGQTTRYGIHYNQ